MATSNNVNPNPATNASAKKKDFSGFLRAVEAERFNPANNPEKPLLLRRQINKAQDDDVLNVRLLQATGVLVSAIWLAGAAVYIQRSIGWSNVSAMMPHEMGGFLAGILSPIALFWMVAAFILRSNDVKKYAETLREEIQTMIFPSEEADRRVNNDIERLMRQTSEMSKATRTALGAIESAREGLKQQVTDLNDNSEHTVDRLNMLGEALYVRMQDVADMGNKLEAMIVAMEERTRHVAERMDAGRSQMEETVSRMDQTGQNLGVHIADATQNSEQSIARLSAMLQERLDALSGLHKETESALQNAAYEISSQRQELRVEAEAIEEKAYGLAEALRKGTGELYNFTDDALDKAKLIETRLQSQSASLQNVLVQSADNAQMIVDNTDQNIEKLRTALESQTLNLQTIAADAVGEAEKIGAVLHNTMDQTVNMFGKATQENAETLTHLVDGAVDRARQLNTTLHDNINQQIDVFGKATEENAENLAGMIENAIANLRQSIEENGAVLYDTTQKTQDTFENLLSGAVSNLRLSVEENTAALQQSVRDAVYESEKMKNLMQDSVADTVNVFRQVTGENTQALENASTEAVERAHKVETVLQQAIDRLAERSNATMEKVQTAMGQATSALISEVDQVGERAKTMSDTMLGEVNRKVADTSAAFTYIQKQIQALVSLFDQRKLDLDNAGASARETAETLQQTLQLALDKVTNVTQSMQTGIGSVQKAVEQPIQLLEDAANFAYSRAGQISQMLGDKASEVTHAAGKIGEEMLLVHDNLHNKGRDVADLAGKIAVHLKELTSEMENQTQFMDGRIAQTTASLNELQNTQQNITDSLGRLQEQSVTAKLQSEESADTIQKRIDILQNLHKSLVQDTAESDRNLHQVSDRLISISSTTVDKIKNSIENMTLLEADYHRLSDAGLEDIQRIEHGYRQLLDQVQEGSRETAEKLTVIHEGIEEKTRESRHAVEAELHALQETAQKVTDTANTLLHSGQEVQVQFNQVQDLGQSAYATLQNLIALSHGFDDKVGKANDLVTVHIGNLQESMVEIENYATKAVGALVEQTGQFTQANDRFMTQTEAMQDNLVKTVDLTEENTDRLRQQIEQLRQDSQQAEAEMNNSVGRLEEQKQTMQETAQELNEALAQARALTVQNSEEMLARLQQAAADIDTRSIILERAAKTAEEQAEALHIQETKLNRQAFFNSAKFIVESLHSLALDFTRLLEGELADKTWKAYQKGDVASFTRRLLSARDEDTRSKIVEKFKNDVEFRTYVQRYFRQYEEIYDAAVLNDHAELLASVFNGSDVGKLYNFLCNTLDRQPLNSRTAEQE